jgi:non-ribosomal peptide synthetase component F
VERVEQALINRSTVAAVVVRPRLWATAVVQLLALAPSGWWHRRPFLPLPDPDYYRFRLQTMYGDADHAPEPRDVVTYLEWCRRFRQALG